MINMFGRLVSANAWYHTDFVEAGASVVDFVERFSVVDGYIYWGNTNHGSVFGMKIMGVVP